MKRANGKFYVDYQMGPGRDVNETVDYMMVKDEWDGEDFELYAEIELTDDRWKPRKHEDADWERYDENDTFEELKAAIIEQAAEQGMPANMLDFQDD